jgi:hypothetical protein
LIEEGPLRHHDQECECRTAQADVESLIDVLSDVACEEGEDTTDAEQDGGEMFGELLALEVLEIVVSELGRETLGSR